LASAAVIVPTELAGCWLIGVAGIVVVSVNFEAPDPLVGSANNESH
jgi:hypothetical protein